MPQPVTAKVYGDSQGNRTPHDDRWVKEWNPHTEAGVLSLTSTDNPLEAKVWPDTAACFREWKTISRVERRRPWDGRPNRPLTGVNLSIDQTYTEADIARWSRRQ